MTGKSTHLNRSSERPKTPGDALGQPESSQTARFGFLMVNEEIAFDGGVARPLPDLPARIEHGKDSANPDGFLYPPRSRTFRQNIAFTSEGVKHGERAEVPGSQRPASLFKLHAPHELAFDAPVARALRTSDGGFIVQLLAYVHGVRLQFEDWFVDQRIPVTIGKTVDFSILEGRRGHIVSRSYSTWKAWPEEVRTRVTNLLYMNSRSPCYEWPWERFTIDYMVFDGLYRTGVKLGMAKDGVRHRTRLDVMCDRFGVPRDGAKLDLIYDLRNGLFHEALWAEGTPGYGFSEEAVFAAMNLRWMNLRLIAGLLGHDNEYVHSQWWSLWRQTFT